MGKGKAWSKEKGQQSTFHPGAVVYSTEDSHGRCSLSALSAAPGLVNTFTLAR